MCRGDHTSGPDMVYSEEAKEMTALRDAARAVARDATPISCDPDFVRVPKLKVDALAAEVKWQDDALAAALKGQKHEHQN